jgi:spore maturation protein CgeB
MHALLVRPGPHFSVADVHRGLVKGLWQNGVEVADLNLDERLDFYNLAHIKKDGEWVKAFDLRGAIQMASQGIAARSYAVWPDIVLVTSGFYLTSELMAILRKRPHHLVLWCTESPYEDTRQLELAPLFDTVILNDPANLEQFRQVNRRTFYLPHSYDPDIHFPGPTSPERASDFAWIGTAYESRMDFFEDVDWRDLDVKLGGMWRGLTGDSPLRRYLMHPDELDHCCDNVEAAGWYRGCKASANLYRKETGDTDHADGWAMGPREVELAACGTFFLREPRGEGDEILGMLPRFKGADDFTDQLHWYMRRPDERQALAEEARYAVADRTFRNTTARLLGLIDSSVVASRMTGATQGGPSGS